MGICYYTDGSCSGNGNADATGGAAFICVDGDKIIDRWQEFYEGEVTNNRMELEAILAAIKHIHKHYQDDFFVPIIYSDSAYCVNTINDWMYRWKEKGWIKSDKKTPENLDIIMPIYYLKEEKGYKFILEKIKGHAGHKWNELVDSMATGKLIFPKE